MFECDRMTHGEHLVMQKGGGRGLFRDKCLRS